jgi:AcrR family transcriptional regulator
MLIYHFGSREGLLAAVVEELERAERDLLAELLSNTEVPRRQLAWQFWTHLADVIDRYGPLYFELASQAMHGDDVRAPLRLPNVEAWVDAIAAMGEAEMDPGQVRAHARLNLAVARGLLHDLLLTRDRKAVDEAMAMFDWLIFREPSPIRSVARYAKRWQAPPTP